MTNYALDTPENIEAAKVWTLDFISHINEGGVWGVPRSCSGYRIWNAKKEYARIVGGEACIETVLDALGYTRVEADNE